MGGFSTIRLCTARGTWESLEADGGPWAELAGNGGCGKMPPSVPLSSQTCSYSSPFLLISVENLVQQAWAEYVKRASTNSATHNQMDTFNIELTAFPKKLRKIVLSTSLSYPTCTNCFPPTWLWSNQRVLLTIIRGSITMLSVLEKRIVAHYHFLGGKGHKGFLKRCFCLFKSHI